MEETSRLDQFSEPLATVANTLKGFFWVGEQKLLITLGYCESKQGQTTSDKLEGIIMNLPFLLAPVYKMLGFSSVASIGLGAFPLGVYFMVSGSLLHGFSTLVHSHAWTVWKGGSKPISPTQVKVMHLNACMFEGSLPYHFGRQTPATERLDALEAKIKKNDPTLLFLCELGQTFSLSLYNRIHENYHLYVVNVGSMPSGFDSDLYFASKMDIQKVDYIESEIPRIGDQRWMNRGYLIVETKEIKYIYTHLHPKISEEAQEVRRRQIEEEILPLMKEGAKPFLLVGDLNIDRNKEEYHLITKHFDDHIKNVPTCVEGDLSESVDYFLTLKGDYRIKITHPEVNLDPDLSDHATLTTIVGLAKKNGETDVVPMHRPGKIDEAFSDQSMFLTKILA